MMLSITLACLTNLVSSVPVVPVAELSPALAAEANVSPPLEGNLTFQFTEGQPFSPLQWAARLAVDRLVYGSTCEEFAIAREMRTPDYVIWDSDACTDLLDRPMGYNCKSSNT